MKTKEGKEERKKVDVLRVSVGIVHFHVATKNELSHKQLRLLQKSQRHPSSPRLPVAQSHKGDLQQMFNPNGFRRPSSLLLSLLPPMQRVGIQDPLDRLEESISIGFKQGAITSRIVRELARWGGREGEGEVMDRDRRREG